MTSLLSIALLGSLPALAAEVSVVEKGHASNPAWSANGEYLAFEVNDYGGSVSLYFTKVGNGNPVGTPARAELPGAKSSFGGSGSLALNPAWHPEGPMMFEGATAGGTIRLYFWQPGGASPSELLSASQVSGDLSWPTVSPDGSKLAFVSDATGKGDLYIWDRGSNAVTQALTSPFSEAAPRFHGGGTKMVYSRKNQGGEDLFVAEGGSSSPLIGGNGDQTRPVYAGDNVVYFSSSRGEGHWDLMVSSGPGKRKTIAKDVRLPVRAAPAVTPDGQWVAYGSDLPEKSGSIYFTKVDGSSTVRVDTGLVAAGEPAVTVVNGRTFLAFTALPSAGADWRRLHVIDITGKI